jgi:hypothetical protein
MQPDVKLEITYHSMYFEYFVILVITLNNKLFYISHKLEGLNLTMCEMMYSN